MLASVLLIIFIGIHIWIGVRGFQTHAHPPIVLGLIGLGGLNGFAGWVTFLGGETVMGVFVMSVGLISINLGMILSDLADWNIHAIRIGVTVFIGGLFVL